MNVEWFFASDVKKSLIDLVIVNKQKNGKWEEVKKKRILNGLHKTQNYVQSVENQYKKIKVVIIWLVDHLANLNFVGYVWVTGKNTRLEIIKTIIAINSWMILKF